MSPPQIIDVGSLPTTRAPSVQSVLSARPFTLFFERERSLADRGTRRLSLLVLRRRAADRREGRGYDPLAELAGRACKRLRSTDLVGRLDADRVEILLTDTEPAGAQVVAAWVGQVEAELGLDLEQMIYVYPSVAEASTDREQDASPRGGPRSNGAGRARSLRTTREASAQLEGAVSDRFWPVEDLWPRLGVPTPLWKRSLDILISAVGLLVLSPLFVLIAIAIRLDSPGPVIFRQLRAGRGARPFVFYKFRSMNADAEEQQEALAGLNEQDGPIFKIRADPRITRSGRLLRRWSIDELPQLWNVLKGDISLVGPRSPTLDEVGKYERWQRRRLSVTGGLTCTWQVSGRSQVSFREWMRLDMRYVACRNLWLDLRILVLTLPAVLSGRGAC